jgi:hypothetical protein
MPYAVDFNTVSTVGLESSPVAVALAGLRANEARYFKNKYDHVFTVEPASHATAVIDWVNRILAEERDIVIASRPPRGSSSRARTRSWPEPFAAPTSPSRTSTDPGPADEAIRRAWRTRSVSSCDGVGGRQARHTAMERVITWSAVSSAATTSPPASSSALRALSPQSGPWKLPDFAPRAGQ